MTDRGRHEIFVLTRRQKVLLLLGVLLCGMSYNVSPFMTVLFREKGFDAVSVGRMASLMGLAICIGKCAYGEAVDRLGRVCAGNLFYACFVLAIILCALCAPGNGFMAYTALALLGFGFPMVSVGLSELAAGTADKAYYADAVKMLQILYTIGSALFGVVPGVLADWLGRYTPSYYLMALMALVGAALQQGVLMSERSKRPA